MTARRFGPFHAVASKARLRARGVRGRVDDHARRLESLERQAARIDVQAGRIAAVERDLARIGPQVAALEARVESVRQRLDTPAGQDLDEAVSIVEEIRREHERIRARVSAAARYEERLRQVEERLADGHHAVQPPSTTRVVPVTNDEAGDAR